MISWAIVSAESEWVEKWAVGHSLFVVSARGLCKLVVIAFGMRAVEDFWTRVGRALEPRCVVGSDVFQRLCCACAVEVNVVVILCTAFGVHPWRCVQGYQGEAGVFAATGCVFARRLA